MKRVIALLLALAVMVCFAACVGKNKEEEKAEPETTVQTEPVTEPSEEATQPTTPAVTTPTKKVNTAKLKSIELQDDFAVKVTNSDIKTNYFEMNGSNIIMGRDAVLVTVQNNSGKTISEFKLLLLGVNAAGQDVLVGDAMRASIYPAPPYSQCVNILGMSDLSMANGTSETGAVQCKAENFNSLYMIIYSYTDSDGNEVINENAVEWLGNTLPV